MDLSTRPGIGRHGRFVPYTPDQRNQLKRSLDAVAASYLDVRPDYPGGESVSRKAIHPREDAQHHFVGPGTDGIESGVPEKA